MTSLKVGDIAPTFKGINQNGEVVDLESFKGKKVLLFFYPKASTPGCTAQACNLRDNYQRFIDNNYEVIGISADSVKRQLNFSNKNELPYSLIADESKEIIEKYNVWGPKKFMGREYDGIHRVSFEIDESGIIKNIISKVKTKEHSDQILS